MTTARAKLIARAMHAKFEDRTVARYGARYTRSQWEELDTASRDEFLDFAEAIDAALPDERTTT